MGTNKINLSRNNERDNDAVCVSSTKLSGDDNRVACTCVTKVEKQKIVDSKS